MTKNWKIAVQLKPEILSRFPEINPLVLQLLFNRGLDSQEKIDEFLNPDYGQDLHDPFLFRDMPQAVTRIRQAIDKNEKAVVHGDYDADGVSGTIVLVSALEAMGLKTEIYLPHREKEGYGVNQQTARMFIEQKFDLVITVDCGISNHEQIKILRDAGVDVIVTDHHEAPQILPQCHAIINPKVKDETYPFRELAGVGVAFKLAQALLRDEELLEKAGKGFEKWLLDLVAIGTVADMMPLLGENRTLVKYGLVVLNKTKRLGLQKLMEAARINQQNGAKKQTKLDTYNIGFQIAPRLNAAGRIDHANTAYELLTTANENEAQRIAEQLNKTNTERQAITEKIVNEAKEKIGEATADKKVLIAVGDNWPIGVVGLAAGRICDEFNRPALIISRQEDELTGSGRSIEEFDITRALGECEEYLARYGGHAQACGFTLKSEKDLGGFIQKMQAIAEQKLAGVSLSPTLSIDMAAELKEINWELFEELEKFEPFGENNRRPYFLCRDLTVVNIDRVGADGKHLRMMVNHQGGTARKTIGFCFGEWCDRINAGDKVDMVFEAGVNEWNGNRELQLKIIDIKVDS